ncbi:MAG: T9SS type A sorting domain-containing protein [Bacteroidales bacterium]|nr:T9SS type A sorting domain-containing protein [Bacteroidales bacterium]
MKKNYTGVLLSVLFFFVSGIKNYSEAQILNAVSATGSASTKSSTYADVAGASVTIDVTGVNYVLVVASFEASMTSSGADVREASYRIADNADATNINSGVFRKSLSNPGSTDFGIGSVVYIFDVRAFSGNRTYVFQHSFNTTARTLTTNAAIVAVALKSASVQLKNELKRVSSPVTMSSTWDAVTGSETTVIKSSAAGGFYVAASLETRTTSFSTASSAEWKLQYKNGSSGTWTDMSPSVEREMSSTSDRAIISLVGTLPDNSTARDYYFRIAHRRTSSSSTIETETANIVAVSFRTDEGVFPVFNRTATGVSTSSSSLSDALVNSVTPQVNTDLFIHAQYAFNAGAETNSPVFDVFVDNSILDGLNQKQYLSGSTDKESGASIGLAKNLIANTKYNVSFRYASASGNTLTLNSLSLNGFALTINSGPMPIDLLYLNAQCGQDSGVVVKWASATEINNDYYTLYKSNDGVNWVVAGKVKGAGNSNNVLYYEFTDEKAMLHDTYYKLKQTDFDGKSEEFKIIIIYCKYNHKKITLYPNPAKDIINLSFYNEHHVEKPLIVYIYNSSGQMCYKQEFFGAKDENLHKINLPATLIQGIYFIHVKLGEEYFYTGKINITN